MSKPTELAIIRPRSTPLRISLVAEHLPAPVRQALEDLAGRRAELATAQEELASARGSDWAPANERLTAVTAAAEQALTDFADISASSSTAVRDAATAAFDKAMLAANEHVRAALDALQDADRAALLAHAVKPGRPVLRYETQAGLDSLIHKRLSMARSELRGQLSQLPDALD